jgi:lipoprotein-anchoring transpeptidase ErfK/SrfK
VPDNFADTGSQPTSLERDVPPPVTEVDSVDPGTSAVSAYAPAVGSNSESELSPGAYSPFESAIQSAATKAQSEQWHDALWTLSLFYGSSDLNDQQRQVLQDWLDPLAAKVIYSQEHLIENPYTVQAADTLQSIADNHRVPWQLLANINGLQDSRELQAGSTLKVIRGPMRAEVDLSESHLTVFVGKLYAGRFPISAGQEPAPQPGEYQIQEKLPGRTYYAGDGQTIPPENPANPFGQVWLDLGDELCIHGSPSSGAPGDRRGCISLSGGDANDLFGILSKGSSVAILQ